MKTDDLSSYIHYKCSIRIICILMSIQYPNKFEKYVMPTNNRENFLELIRNFHAYDIFTPNELEFLKSHANLIPFNRIRTHYNSDPSYVMFHATRITNILNEVPTPMNTLDNGVTNMGTFIGLKTSIISSLFEIGIIPWEAQHYFFKNMEW